MQQLETPVQSCRGSGLRPFPFLLRAAVATGEGQDLCELQAGCRGLLRPLAAGCRCVDVFVFDVGGDGCGG